MSWFGVFASGKIVCQRRAAGSNLHCFVIAAKLRAIARHTEQTAVPRRPCSRFHYSAARPSGPSQKIRGETNEQKSGVSTSRCFGRTGSVGRRNAHDQRNKDRSRPLCGRGRPDASPDSNEVSNLYPHLRSGWRRPNATTDPHEGFGKIAAHICSGRGRPDASSDSNEVSNLYPHLRSGWRRPNATTDPHEGFGKIAAHICSGRGRPDPSSDPNGSPQGFLLAW